MKIAAETSMSVRSGSSSPSSTMRSWLFGAVAVFAIDQVAKVFFGMPLAKSPHEVSARTFLLVSGLIGLLLATAAYRLGWKRNRIGLFAALVFLCAGGASNFADRAIRGHVLVYLSWRELYNLGDIAMCVSWLALCVMGQRWIRRVLHEMASSITQG